MRKRDEISFEEMKKFGFKYGTRDRFEYKTKENGVESRIYINMLPCHNNKNELKIECPSHSIPRKIVNKLYDLITAGIVEK